MPAWYNENDPAAATWLEEMIHEGELPDGVVDRRSIKDVRADDLRGFDQCHFFAGIGIWPAAARAAGWPDRRPIWTGSCPCQPFSRAGKGLGFDDPRHLWPDWFRLVAECRPHQIFGEQTTTANLWIDLVRLDLESIGAAFASPSLSAPGFAGGAHIRDRFYWVADLHHAERWADMAARHIGDWPETGRVEGHGQLGTNLPVGGMGNANDEGLARWRLDEVRGGSQLAARSPGVAGNVDWLYCRDEKIRPVEAGTFPLAATDPARVGLLRGYGNALDFETAKAFVTAFLEAEMLS